LKPLRQPQILSLKLAKSAAKRTAIARIAKKIPKNQTRSLNN
jgi:hypothetical protein